MKVIASFLSNALFNFAIGLLLARFLGPEDYGRFAIAVAIAVVVQTIAFDWMRLAAARFYSDRVRTEQPEVRATLDTSFALIVMALGLVTLLVLLAPVDLPLSRAFMGLAIGTAVVNGLFDLQVALIRARFLDGVYARLIIGKNLLSMVLTVGGAFWFASAKLALLGVALSMVGAMLSVGRTLLDRPAAPRLADRRLAGVLFGYALPIVLANLLYQSIPFVDRLLIARTEGYAASGQFSFAYDLGIRIVAAVGSMLDVLLFQIAVRVDELHGSTEAKRQIGDNIGIVVAVLTPACVGVWLVLPSFEALAAPPDFQGAFSRYLALMLPGLYGYGLIFFAFHPLFQITRTTLPLVLMAGAASLANGAALVLLPASHDAARYAAAVSLALLTGLVLLALGAALTRPVWPRFRDVIGAAVATVGMALMVKCLPYGEPGLLLLLGQAALGSMTYAVLALSIDLCGCRQRVSARLRHRAI